MLIRVLLVLAGMHTNSVGAVMLGHQTTETIDKTSSNQLRGTSAILPASNEERTPVTPKYFDFLGVHSGEDTSMLNKEINSIEHHFDMAEPIHKNPYALSTDLNGVNTVEAIDYKRNLLNFYEEVNKFVQDNKSKEYYYLAGALERRFEKIQLAEKLEALSQLSGNEMIQKTAIKWQRQQLRRWIRYNEPVMTNLAFKPDAPGLFRSWNMKVLTKYVTLRNQYNYNHITVLSLLSQVYTEENLIKMIATTLLDRAQTKTLAPRITTNIQNDLLRQWQIKRLNPYEVFRLLNMKEAIKFVTTCDHDLATAHYWALQHSGQYEFKSWVEILTQLYSLNDVILELYRLKSSSKIAHMLLYREMWKWATLKWSVHQVDEKLSFTHIANKYEAAQRKKIFLNDYRYLLAEHKAIHESQN